MNGIDWGSLVTAIVALIGAVTAHYRVSGKVSKTPPASNAKK